MLAFASLTATASGRPARTTPASTQFRVVARRWRDPCRSSQSNAALSASRSRASQLSGCRAHRSRTSLPSAPGDRGGRRGVVKRQRFTTLARRTGDGVCCAKGRPGTLPTMPTFFAPRRLSRSALQALPPRRARRFGTRRTLARADQPVRALQRPFLQRPLQRPLSLSLCHARSRGAVCQRRAPPLADN